MFIQVNNIHQYQSSYDSLDIRGRDDPKTPRPWNLHNLIKKHSGRNKKIMLDIGCGTAFKLIPLSPYFSSIIGIDPSSSMREEANKKIRNERIKNITIKDGIADNISNLNIQFDVITAMLAKFNIKEIHRSIKKDGKVIIEYIGCEDKLKFKKYFGKDENGWRGQLLHYKINDYLDYIYSMFTPYFENVLLENGYWDTFYTKSGLITLLENTPTIRSFSSKDYKIIDKLSNELMTKEGIKITQNRILIYAEYPKLL